MVDEQDRIPIQEIQRMVAVLEKREPKPKLPDEPARPVDEEILAKIQTVATQLRGVLDKADTTLLPIPFRKFPRGSCDAASEALGIHIREQLGYECVSAQGMCALGEEYSTHTWLEYGDLIIDITADQFGQAPVIVTRSSPWHARFGGVRQPLGIDPAWIKRNCDPVLQLVR